MQSPKSGTFCAVFARPSSNFVQKRLRHQRPLPENAAKNLKSCHDLYVRMISPLVNVPATKMSLAKAGDGLLEVRIVQENLDRLDGSYLPLLIENARDADARRGLMSAFFARSLNFRADAEAHWGSDGKMLGIDSCIRNWWISGKGEWRYFDTVPPLMRNGEGRDAMIAMMNLGPNQKRIAGLKIYSIPGMKPLMRYVHRDCFEPQDMLRHALLTATWDIPRLKGEFEQVARETIAGIKDDAMRKRCEKAMSTSGMFVYSCCLRLLLHAARQVRDSGK